MPGAVQEVRVAEGDVGGPGLHELPHVGEHDRARDHEEAPAVDRRNRAVGAQMPAAAAGLHVPGKLLTPAVLEAARTSSDPEADDGSGEGS